MLHAWERNPRRFSPNPRLHQFRRRLPKLLLSSPICSRIKCFVAVEIRVDDAVTPLWGNLSNTSVGGCLVETATAVPPGAKVEVGLWVANGKLWVKGFALNGIVTRSGRSAGVRVRFDALTSVERDSLRQFLKFVQDSTRASQSESTYLQLLK
jgi:hypothetical protein